MHLALMRRAAALCSVQRRSIDVAAERMAAIVRDSAARMAAGQFILIDQ
jgi:hypothetical protein